MAASYTATAKRAMCGVSASLNSRSATAAFHPPHTTPSPASENITNTIVLLNEQLAWKAAETYRVWLPDAENEASDKIQSNIPTMTQQNKDVYGLHLSFTTTEHTKSYQGFRINWGVATSTDACSTLLDFISVMMLLVCGMGTAGHLGHSYSCYFTCHSAFSWSVFSPHVALFSYGLQPLPLWSQTDYGWCVLTNSVTWVLPDNFLIILSWLLSLKWSRAAQKTIKPLNLDL